MEFVAWIVFAAATTVHARPAPADEPPITTEEARRVEELARAAKAALDAGDHDEAIRRLQEAIRLYPAPWLLYNLGRTYEAKGDDVLARAHFELCLSKGPEETVRARAEEALARVEARLAPGRLRLARAIAGVTVTIDGERAGVTPLPPVTLPPGPHRVRLEKAGFAPREHEVEVPAGGEVALDVVMEPVAREEPRAVPVAPPPTAAAESPYGPWQWVTLGVGVAAVGGGVALYLLGEADLQEVRDADGYGTGGVVAMSARRARDLEQSGNTKRGGGIGLMAFGGAALAASVTLIVLDAAWDEGGGGDGGGDEGGAFTGPHPTAAPVPGGAVVGFGGRF